VAFQPESLNAAQHDAGRDLVPAVQVDEGVGDECAVGTVALAEVAGQFDAVRVHCCAPITRPGAAEQVRRPDPGQRGADLV